MFVLACGKKKMKGLSIPCDLCEGTGKVTDERLEWIEQGKRLRELRMSKNLSLRKAAKKYGVDHSDLSKMERGVKKPWNCYGL